MKFFRASMFVLVLVFSASVFAGNSVVNLSHYDLMRVNFEAVKREGVVGVIHEATYPRFDRDSYYGTRQTAAARAGLLWGAYHFGDATDPIRQAEHFLSVVAANWRGPAVQPARQRNDEQADQRCPQSVCVFEKGAASPELKRQGEHTVPVARRPVRHRHAGVMAGHQSADANQNQ